MSFCTGIMNQNDIFLVKDRPAGRRRNSMKKKTIIAFFCATLSVCAIYGGLRYIVLSGTGHVTMAEMLEEENSIYQSIQTLSRDKSDSSSGQAGNCGSTDSSIRNCMKFTGKPVHLPCKKIHRGIQLFPKSGLL